MNILLVDDDYLLAKGTAKLLERLGGHCVAITEDPLEIFKHCRSGAIDLVLMDVNLPGAIWEGQEVSGTDISRMLKTDHLTAHIPIVLITAYAMLTERQTLLLTSQADEFYAKPITDYDKLLKMIEHLGKQATRS